MISSFRTKLSQSDTLLKVLSRQIPYVWVCADNLTRSLRGFKHAFFCLTLIPRQYDISNIIMERPEWTTSDNAREDFQWFALMHGNVCLERYYVSDRTSLALSSRFFRYDILDQQSPIKNKDTESL